MKLGIFLLTLVAVAAACNNSNSNGPTNSSTPVSQTTATPDEFALVRPIYAKHCVECHGADGAGGPVTVDGKKLKVPSLREGHALKHTDEDFTDQIKEGGDGMPRFEDKLKPEEISELVRFVRKELQHKQ